MKVGGFDRLLHSAPVVQPRPPWRPVATDCSCLLRQAQFDPNPPVGLLQSCPTLGPSSLGFCVYEVAVRGHRDPATCRHPTRQEVVTPMTGFKVQPPYAGRQLEAHSLKRSLAASRRPQPVNRPMRPVRPQFDRPNRNCRAQGCDRAGSASDRLERLQIPAVRHKHFKCSCHIASYGHSARITRQPSCRRGVTRAGQQACGL